MCACPTNLGVLELLFHILNDSLAVEALEGSGDQLWVDWMRAYNLTSDLQHGSNLGSGQLTHSVLVGDGW